MMMKQLCYARYPVMLSLLKANSWGRESRTDQANDGTKSQKCCLAGQHTLH